MWLTLFCIASCRKNLRAFSTSPVSFLNFCFSPRQFLHYNHQKMSASGGNVFKGSQDRFDGITVHSSVENCTLYEFPKKLEDSLCEWEKDNKRGIWFRVATEHADWVPILAKKGFNFHNARNNLLTMYKWLPKEPCNIPQYAHTMIGVGAVVVNEKQEILVVQEKHWNIPHWKLPGGYVEPGENLVDAAIREVFEETNIHAEFVSLLNVRHGHVGMFGCSDLYFVVNLKPLSNDIEKCDREIADCRWLGLDEYLSHPNVHELNRFFVESFLVQREKGITIDCKHGIHQILKKPYTVYYAKI